MSGCLPPYFFISCRRIITARVDRLIRVVRAWEKPKFWMMRINLSNEFFGCCESIMEPSPSMGTACSLSKKMVKERVGKDGVESYIKITIAIALMNARSKARLKMTSTKPRRRSPSTKVITPTWKVMIVVIAMAIAFLSASLTIASAFKMDDIVCPTSKQREASGATFRCLDVPKNA